ncbi:MAG: hypothetical protein FWH08_04325 [Oscillospiraceae bacterium]|nr:hypothetical protein [Oscillospiraceae bacterium]
MKRKSLVLALISALLFSACVRESETARPYVPPQAEFSPSAVFEEAVPTGASVSAPREFSATEAALNLKTSPITTDTDWLDYEIVNHTAAEYTYGEDFTLFRDKDGGWEYVDMLPDSGWNDIGIILTPHSVNNGSIDIGHFFGTLSMGTYRIEKDVFSEDEAFIAAVEFEVTSGK